MERKKIIVDIIPKSDINKIEDWELKAVITYCMADPDSLMRLSKEDKELYNKVLEYLEIKRTTVYE